MLCHLLRQCGERLGYAAQRTEENARGAGFRIEYGRRARFGEFARLAAELVVTIASGARQLGHIDRFDDLVLRERRREGASDEMRDQHTALASAPRTLTEAPSAASASGQSAAGSA